MKLKSIPLSCKESKALSWGRKNAHLMQFSKRHKLKGKMCKYTKNAMWYLEHATKEDEKTFSDFVRDCISSDGWWGYLEW